MQGKPAARDDSYPTNTMNEQDMLRVLGNCCNQEHAAALAVIAGAIRHNIDAENRLDNLSGTKQEEGEMIEQHLLVNWLRDLETAMVTSIANNDGNVAYNIGRAAKQMSPLL